MSIRNRNQYPAQVRQEFEYADRRIASVRGALSFVPVGGRISYDGLTEPDGWLFCDGAELSREKYVALFRVMGVQYGAGDTTSSFNLPTAAGEIIFTGVA